MCKGEGGRSAKCDHGRVRLGRLVQFRRGEIDGREIDYMVCGARGDYRDQVVDLPDLRGDPFQHPSRFAHQLDTVHNVAGAGRDKALDIFGGIGRTLRQCADFIGYDSEALASFNSDDFSISDA